MAALAEELIAKGSIKEQLENFKTLAKTIADLQKDVGDLPTLPCDKVLVFKPSKNLERLTVGTIEEANYIDASTDCGRPKTVGFIFFRTRCSSTSTKYIGL